MARENLDDEEELKGGEMVEIDLDADDEEKDAAKEAKKGDAKKADAKADDKADDEDDDKVGDDDGDDRLGDDQRAAAEGETLEEKRARRREEKKRRREAAREAKHRAYQNERLLSNLKEENLQLAARLSMLEAGSARTDITVIRRGKEDARYRFGQAEEALAKAIEAGNGEVARDAIRLRDKAKAEFEQLDYQERTIVERAQRPERQQGDGMDPVVRRRADQFIERNSDWYDPQGGNDDSAVVLALDNKLAAEGYDPRTNEYWDELEKRAARLLPNRFKKGRQQDADDEDDDDEPARKSGRRGPPTGGRGEHAPASTRKQVFVSAERKQAMIEAGVWDDPVARKRMLKRYAEMDRQNATSR